MRHKPLPFREFTACFSVLACFTSWPPSELLQAAALLMQDPNFCEDADMSKEQYRQYLLERLRIPAGVVFGHGLVNLALIQVTYHLCTVHTPLSTLSSTALEWSGLAVIDSLGTPCMRCTILHCHTLCLRGYYAELLSSYILCCGLTCAVSSCKSTKDQLAPAAGRSLCDVLLLRCN